MIAMSTLDVDGAHKCRQGKFWKMREVVPFLIIIRSRVCRDPSTSILRNFNIVDLNMTVTSGVLLKLNRANSRSDELDRRRKKEKEDTILVPGWIHLHAVYLGK